MRERVDELRKIIPTQPANNIPEITDENKWKKYFLEDYPRLTSVLCLSQPHIDILLEYHAAWLQELEPGSDINKIGVWIYS
ncbi:SIP1 domain-containing protein, partial [Klebsiella pneumoniae]|nr:SIP1 domain-containing protein [Klebsiella pneumoniae]